MRTLSPESFHLAGAEPTIVVQAKAAKSRRRADQPIPRDLARDLTAWLVGKPPGIAALPLHHETAKMIRQDLEAAGVAYETEDGIADFHSLRAYYVSALVRAGASVKEVQTLARHAQPQTTLNHYAKVSLRDLRGAIESLPALDVSQPQPEALAATGTEGRQKPPATGFATGPDRESPKSLEEQALPINALVFDKPLYLSKGIGGSNPPSPLH